MKSLINYPLLKEQIKRFWSIGAMAFLWYGLFVVSPLYSSVSKSFYMEAAVKIIEVVTMRSPVIQIALVAVPFAAVLSMFSYMFQPKSTAAIHSWPLSKKQLYFTNIAAGFILIAIPLIILCVFLLRPVVWHFPEYTLTEQGIQYLSSVTYLPAQIYKSGVSDGVLLNTLPIVIGFLLKALMTSMFYYSIFLAAIMVTGSPAVYVLLCGFFPLVPCAFMLLGFLTGNFYLLGFESYQFDDLLMKVLIFTNPVILGTSYSFYSPPQEPPAMHESLLPNYISYILIALALYVLSYWCNKVRKQERAGDSVVFVPLRNVLIFLVSMAGMIFLGAFFLGVSKSVPMMYAGFVLGFIVAYFIAQMIAEKAFNILYKANDIVKYGGVMAALLVAVIISARIDLLGYQSYSPQLSQVEGVFLHQPYRMNNHLGTELDEEYRRNFFVTDKKIIEDTLSVHKQIIDERHSLREPFLRSLEGNMYENGITEQYITILLKDGKYIYRRYVLPEDFGGRPELTQLLSEEDVILSIYSSFKTPENIEGINILYDFLNTDLDMEYMEKTALPSGRGSFSESVYIDDPEEISEVLEEIKKDIVIREQKRLADPEAEMEFNPQISVNGYTETMYEGKLYSDDHFNLTSYENVDRWLESKGLRPEAPNP